MSIDVKSDKTFEEIVERLIALFKLTPHSGEPDLSESIEVDCSSQPTQTPQPAGGSTDSSKNKG